MASEGVLNLRASTFSNLPEPSVVVLLAIGGAGLLSCAARRWSRWMLRA
jgi:hypothetical protein